MVFNLDQSVTNEELCRVFSQFGEVKEIRETPKKTNHKFVEYYDVRAAANAMQSLNNTEVISCEALRVLFVILWNVMSRPLKCRHVAFAWSHAWRHCLVRLVSKPAHFEIITFLRKSSENL